MDIIALHELRHRQFLLLVGGKVGGVHLLRFELLSVELCGEIPAFGIGLTLVGVSMCHFLAVDRHHLRFTGLAFLLRLAVVVGFDIVLLLCRRLFLDRSLGGLGRLFLLCLFFLGISESVNVDCSFTRDCRMCFLLQA